MIKGVDVGKDFELEICLGVGLAVAVDPGVGLSMASLVAAMRASTVASISGVGSWGFPKFPHALTTSVRMSATAPRTLI